MSSSLLYGAVKAMMSFHHVNWSASYIALTPSFAKWV